MWRPTRWALLEPSRILASLAASVIVVMPSVALINEAHERRSRRRWVSFVVFTQLAEKLDRWTLQLRSAYRALEWWATRIGTTAPISSVPGAGSADPPVA